MKNQRPEIGGGQKVQSPDLVLLLVELALGCHQENVNLRIARQENLLVVLVREANQAADLAAVIQEMNVKNDHDLDTRAEVDTENNIGRVYIVIEVDFFK